MSAAATGRGIAERLAGRRRPRLFATQVEEPRARRATDAVLLVAAAVALALLGSIAVPQAGFERALIALARSLPGGLDGLWRILTELPALASVALLVETLVRRRTSLLRDLLLAVGVVLGASLAWNALLFVNVTVSLLAGLLPVPGGVGVVEGGLTLGLTGAGLPEEIAFAAALMYRVATFYLPPVWGFFALRWLERNQHL
jgi:hypothetical protein